LELDSQSTEEIDHPLIKREIDRVQRIVEGQNLEIKKTLFKYAEIIEQQRRILHQKRWEILHDSVIVDVLWNAAPEQFCQLNALLELPELKALCRQLALLYLDQDWSYYLADIADIREGIHLKSLGRQQPLLEFIRLAVALFDERQSQFEANLVDIFRKLEIRHGQVDLASQGLIAPSATWTYLVNDNPFEKLLGAQIMGDLALSIGAGIWGPLVAVVAGLRKLHTRKRSKISDGMD
jgi:preprotein translocase subunit SecA